MVGELVGRILLVPFKLIVGLVALGFAVSMVADDLLRANIDRITAVSPHFEWLAIALVIGLKFSGLI